MDDNTPNPKPAVVVEAGGLVDKSRLTLGVHGETVDPDEISRLLGCAPTSAHRRGDLRRSGPPWPKGAWLLSVEAESPAGPDELAHLLLGRLPADEALWADLRGRFRVQLMFGIFTERWNRGFELSANAVRLINALGIGVGVDIYANFKREEDG
jgi:hypothetical protein